MKRLHAAAANGTGDAGASGAMGAEALKQQMQQLQRDTDAQIADLQVQALTLLRAKERERVCVCVCVCVCACHIGYTAAHMGTNVMLAGVSFVVAAWQARNSMLSTELAEAEANYRQLLDKTL